VILTPQQVIDDLPFGVIPHDVSASTAPTQNHPSNEHSPSLRRESLHGIRRMFERVRIHAFDGQSTAEIH
jgi:hypothetical protein